MPPAPEWQVENERVRFTIHIAYKWFEAEQEELLIELHLDCRQYRSSYFSCAMAEVTFVRYRKQLPS